MIKSPNKLCTLFFIFTTLENVKNDDFYGKNSQEDRLDGVCTLDVEQSIDEQLLLNKQSIF